MILQMSYTCGVMKDYYDSLGVPRDASQADIKHAYRILAHQFHPDKEYGNEKRFREISEAYLAISDEKSKAEYDQKFGTENRTTISGQEIPTNIEKDFEISNGNTQMGPIIGAVVFSCIVILGAVGFVKGGFSSSTENTVVQQIATTTSQTSGMTAKTSSVVPKQLPAISNASGNLTPFFIAAVEPNIVEINCYSYDNSIESSGSGVSFLYSPTGTQPKQNLIYTNYHVYTGAVVNGQPPTCYAVFPEPPNFVYNGSYGDYRLSLNAWHYDPNIYEDSALFAIGAPLYSPLNSIPVMNDVSKEFGLVPGKGQCSATAAKVGDSITIFGYPSSGNLLGVSETVTDGIISGILPGPIYKTNAAIDHGNSGGVAILNKSGCALGIPTLGESGLTAGIGYVQSYILASQAINQGS